MTGDRLQVTKTDATSVTRHASRVTQPIGLLGGTFDPIHHGHLRLAEEMGAALGLDEVRIMPTGVPPHRLRPIAGVSQRRAMVELAITGNPRFRIEAIELEKTGPCYMVDTLEALRAELGADTPIVLVVGADVFAGLSSWHEWQRLFDLCHFAVALRPGYTNWERTLPPALEREYRPRRRDQAQAMSESLAGYVITRPVTQLDISATRIRADVAAGRNPRYLLPDPVLEHIYQHQLYL